jgi:hypothetical protein
MPFLPVAVTDHTRLKSFQRSAPLVATIIWSLRDKTPASFLNHTGNQGFHPLLIIAICGSEMGSEQSLFYSQFED